MQGLFVPIAWVGSSDPVRVLRLYTMNTLDTLWSIYCWDICTTCRYQTDMLSYCWMCTSWVLSMTDCRMIAALYCAVPFIVACVDVSRTVIWDRSSVRLSNHLHRHLFTMLFCSLTPPIACNGTGRCYIIFLIYCWIKNARQDNSWIHLVVGAVPASEAFMLLLEQDALSVHLACGLAEEEPPNA